MKNFKLSIIFIPLFFLLTGCSDFKKEPTNIKEAKDSHEITVGVSILDGTNPYFMELLKGIRNECAQLNYKVLYDDPGSDVEKQKKSIENYINQKVDAIIVTTIDSELIDDLLFKAREDGIKVIAQSTEVENCDMYVSADEWSMGHTLGRHAGKWIRDMKLDYAKVVILNDNRFPQIKVREKGIMDGIKEIAPNVRIIARKSISSPEESKTALQEIIKQHSDINAVVSFNDAGAIGALKAFDEAGRLKDENLYIGGIDATPEALQYINSGTAFRCTVDVEPEYNGKADVDFINKLLNNQIVPDKYIMPINLIEQKK